MFDGFFALHVRWYTSNKSFVKATKSRWLLPNVGQRHVQAILWKKLKNRRQCAGPLPGESFEDKLCKSLVYETRLQHSKKGGCPKTHWQPKLKCGPPQHTSALSFEPQKKFCHKSNKAKLTICLPAASCPTGCMKRLDRCYRCFLLKRQNVQFTFQKVTRISFLIVLRRSI